MIEDLDDQSIAEMHAKPSKIKKVFNPYEEHYQRPTSITFLQQESNECRICLQASNSAENQLVSPCKCTGSVKYMHDQCFRRWVDSAFRLKSKREQIELIKHGIQCEICKAKIGLNFIADYSCCNLTPFCRKWKQNPIIFMLYIFLSIIIFAGIIFMIIKITNNDINFEQDLTAGIIIICGLIFLTAALITIIYYCLVDYLLNKSWILLSYQKKDVRNMEIIPVEND